MIRNDIKSLKFVADYQKKHYDWISDVTFKEKEDYGIDLDLITTDNRLFKEEVKTCRSQSIKNEDGSFNDYFRLGNNKGMFKNGCWKNTPNKYDNFKDINKLDVSNISYGTVAGSVPEELSDKYCYMLNASTTGYYNGLELCPNRCKFTQVFGHNNTILVYLAQDGMIIWTNKQLKEAFLGYMWLWCPHTQDFDNNEYGFELKALFDMSKGTYIKCDVPKEVLARS